MRTRIKEFTLHVEPATGCVDWAQLSWPDPVNPTWPFQSTVPPGTASLTPNVPSLSSVFSWNVSNGDGFGAGGVASGGLLTYNGPACNCNLAYSITNTGDPLAGLSAHNVTITVVGVAVVVNLLIKPLGVGTHVANIPFTIPDTLGVPRTVTVQFAVSAVPSAWPHPIVGSAGLCVLTTI